MNQIIGYLLISVGGILSYSTMAENLVINTADKESNYESSLQGWLNVNASVFNAPCNLLVKQALSLTHCGAGDVFDDVAIRHATAKTPVILQFYDVRQGHVIRRYSLGLFNGNNAIKLPFLDAKPSMLRLEVIYE